MAEQSPADDELINEENTVFLNPAMTYALLFALIQDGQCAQLKLYLNNANILSTDNGDSLLHTAVRYGQFKCAELLIEKGIDINQSNLANLTPFGLIVSLISNNPKDETINQGRLDIAWLLIRKKAVLAKDALHRAIGKELYRLVKIILNSRFCDVNLKDTGITPLRLAIIKQNKEIVARLLADSRLSKPTIDEAYVIAREKAKALDTSDSNAILQLLEKKQKEVLPRPVGSNWIRNLTVSYGCHIDRPHKKVVVKNDEHHTKLAFNNSMTRQLLSESQTTKQYNPATASITFIVSKPSLLAGNVPFRDAITIDIDWDENHHISNQNDDNPTQTELESIAHRIRSAPFSVTQNGKDIKALQDSFENWKKNKAPGFNQDYHHGEQSWLDYMERREQIKKLMEKFQKHAKFIPGLKVHAIIANVFTPRYPCGNCQTSILGEQNSEASNFLKFLSEELNNIGCHVPRYSPLRMITLVSSIKPHEINQVNLNSHIPYEIDIRGCNNTMLLIKDLLATFNQDSTQFLSTELNK